MKKVSLLVIGLVLCSVPLFAGEYLMNDTLRTVYGLRVTFSEPVSISSYGDIFTAVEPASTSTEFVFSGGELGPWDGHWFNWEPATAQIAGYKWLTEGDSLASAPLDVAAQDFAYSVPLADLEIELTIERHIERNCLPFAVRYEIADPQLLDGYLVTWDVDKYVDSDVDGDPKTDRDAEGTALDLLYVENYNPTITLNILDEAGLIVSSWENMVRNDFEAGQIVILDGNKLLEAHGIPLTPDAAFTWQQRHMEQNSLEYMTEYIAEPQDPQDDLTNFKPQYAGRYVYSLEVALAGDVQVLQVAGWVTERPTGSARKIVLMMADVWNDWFDNDVNRVEDVGTWFTDADAIEKIRYLGDVGFENIAVCTGFVLKQTVPDPLLTSEAVHVESDSDLRMLFSEIENPHLRISSWAQNFDYDPVFADPSAWVQFDSLPLPYYESYFRQYRELLLDLAALAEESGVVDINVGSNHAYVWGLGGIDQANHTAGRFVAEQWVELISDVREVFSGRLGITAIHPDTPAARPLIGVPDYVEYLTGSFCPFGDCTHGDRIAATSTAEDLRVALAAFARDVVDPVSLEMGRPVEFEVAASSFLGAARLYNASDHEQSGYDSWRPEFAFGGYEDEIISGEAMAPFQPSFRDQSLLLETFLPVLASMPNLDSIWLWGEYWKLMDFENFAPEHQLELNAVNAMTLQGKPGFQVARLWASILDPNERLLYRLGLPWAEDDDGPMVFGDVESLSETLVEDWAKAPYQITFPVDFRPIDYWFNASLYPISDSEHWDLPGHDVESIRLQVTSEVLGIYLDSHADDLRNEFVYQLRFRPPNDRDMTLFVEIAPVHERVYITVPDGTGERRIPTNAIGYKISDESITVLIPDLEISSEYSILDVADWMVEMSIVFAVPGGEEIYNLFSGDSYNSTLSGSTNEPVVESVENLPNASATIAAITWENVPVIFTYPTDATVEYYCNGDENFANARFWERPGKEVQTVRMDLTDDSLLMDVELHEEDQLGSFDYVTSFYLSNGNMVSVTIMPSLELFEVKYYDTEGNETLVYSAIGASYDEMSRAAYAVIPWEAIGVHVSRDMFCEAAVELNLIFHQGSRYELYFFPGGGQVPLCSDQEEIPASVSTKTPVSVSYDEIMATIAQYPGEDEPLYEPAPDEAIWLTDLEGHADIYDNDSIKINYADWFDKSQISRIEIRRNGIKMQFLPDMLDVLTNEQMKTFDGDPREYTPESQHTDHAVFGYAYTFHFEVSEGEASQAITVIVNNPISYAGDTYAYIGQQWPHPWEIPAMSDARLRAELRRVRSLGFVGICLDTYYYMESEFSSSLFLNYTKDDNIHYTTTPNEALLRRVLRLAEEEGLETWLRIQVQVANEYKNSVSHFVWRGSIQPRDVSDWFSSYSAICRDVARIAEEEGVGTLCLGVELLSMREHVSEWASVVAEIHSIFSGMVTYDEVSNILIDRVQCSGSSIEEEAGKLWEAFDRIEMNYWQIPGCYSLDTETDQRFSLMVEGFVEFWTELFNYYRTTYPTKPVAFGEMGHFLCDGTVIAGWWTGEGGPTDYQEAADVWATYMIAAEYFGTSATSVWAWDLNHPEKAQCDLVSIRNTPASQVVASFLK